MTRDDIIRMAQEAAIMPPNWGATENQWRTLHDFADLVAAATREECAKVCDIETALWEENSDGQVSLRSVAAVIRARGQE